MLGVMIHELHSASADAPPKESCVLRLRSQTAPRPCDDPPEPVECPCPTGALPSGFGLGRVKCGPRCLRVANAKIFQQASKQIL